MPARWSFFAFNWSKFRELKPGLQAASESGDFSALRQEEAVQVLEGFSETSAPEEIANALVTELCGTGEALFFEGGLPELIHRLRKEPRSEDATDLLGALVSGEPHIEDWFRVESGLVGILSQSQTKDLSQAFELLRRDLKPPSRPKGLGAITRRFATTEAAGDRLEDLFKLVDNCAKRNLGVGVLREP